MNLHFKILLNDFKKNFYRNIILFVFMSLSVTITICVVLMVTQLFSSINKMYQTAKPPHFLQMHTASSIDFTEQKNIDDFNKNFSGVTHWQTVPMITVYGESILVTDNNINTNNKYFTLSDCKLDISFVKQNAEYDVLLNKNREAICLNDGEIGIPVIVLDQYDINIGDKIIVSENNIKKTFTVTTYVNDGMMNSTTCSSTRFLLSDNDFNFLFGNVGENEYLIETYFTDTSLATSYQSAYEQRDKNLPKNGQAITYKIIFLLSALTDILTAFVLVLTGTLFIFVVVMCLRYIILAELEDDSCQIGTLKSIGIPDSKIQNLYSAKIKLLILLSSILGFCLALMLLPKCTSHITRFFGKEQLSLKSILFSIIALLLIYCVVIFFTKKTLLQIKKKTIVSLLVQKEGFAKKIKVKSFLYKSKKLSTNILISLNECRKSYGIVFFLMLIITFLIMVPLRSLQTMKAKNFVTYMGSPICDLLLEVVQGESLEQRNVKLLEVIKAEQKNGFIKSTDTLRRVRLQALSNLDELVGLHIDTGLTSGKGIIYLAGKNPTSKNQIALSYLVAQELKKYIGDELKIITKEETILFTVCGIYQDVTSGGRTAKSIYEFAEENAEKYTYQIKLSNKILQEDFIVNLKEKLGSGYSVKNMEGFIEQTLGGVTKSLSRVVYFVVLLGIIVAIFIVFLFMELRFARTIQVLKEKIVIGIPIKSICLQELYPMIFVGGSGIVLGIFVTEFLGAKIVSALFSLLDLGITNILFAPITLTFIFIPLSLFFILTFVTMCVCIKKLSFIKKNIFMRT